MLDLDLQNSFQCQNSLKITRTYIKVFNIEWVKSCTLTKQNHRISKDFKIKLTENFDEWFPIQVKT